MSIPGKTLSLAERHGKHLDPLRGIGANGGAGGSRGDTGEDVSDGTTTTTTATTSTNINSTDAPLPCGDGACNASCCPADNTRDVGNVAGAGASARESPEHEGDLHHKINKFKLGADSIDLSETTLENFYGFLSPTSPSVTSPTTPTSPSPLKSSIRDPSRPKTPPGTPNRKSVRFADALGLDLETVKTILRNESPPDLNVHVDEERQTISAKALSLCFQQPGGQPDFISRLNKQNVCLENVVIHEFTLIGTIKVRNLGFEKAVRIRHSSDNWQTFVDVMAMYVQGSCDGPTDRFSFGLSAQKSMAPGAILRFAIYYKVAGDTFWDNNRGENYSLICEEIKKG